MSHALAESCFVLSLQSFNSFICEAVSHSVTSISRGFIQTQTMWPTRTLPDGRVKVDMPGHSDLKKKKNNSCVGSTFARSGTVCNMHLLSKNQFKL